MLAVPPKAAVSPPCICAARCACAPIHTPLRCRTMKHAYSRTYKLFVLPWWWLTSHGAMLCTLAVCRCVTLAAVQRSVHKVQAQPRSQDSLQTVTFRVTHCHRFWSQVMVDHTVCRLCQHEHERITGSSRMRVVCRHVRCPLSENQFVIFIPHRAQKH